MRGVRRCDVLQEHAWRDTAVAWGQDAGSRPSALLRVIGAGRGSAPGTHGSGPDIPVGAHLGATPAWFGGAGSRPSALLRGPGALRAAGQGRGTGAVAGPDGALPGAAFADPLVVGRVAHGPAQYAHARTVALVVTVEGLLRMVGA